MEVGRASRAHPTHSRPPQSFLQALPAFRAAQGQLRLFPLPLKVESVWAEPVSLNPHVGLSPHLRWPPPVLADSAMLPGSLQALALTVWHFCRGRNGSQYMGILRAPPVCPRAVARPHLCMQGHPTSPARALAAADRNPVGTRTGQRPTTSANPFAPPLCMSPWLTRLCRLDVSGSVAFPATFSASFRSVSVTPWMGRAVRAGPRDLPAPTTPAPHLGGPPVLAHQS